MGNWDLLGVKRLRRGEQSVARDCSRIVSFLQRTRTDIAPDQLARHSKDGDGKARRPSQRPQRNRGRRYDRDFTY
jgi:hypothetical protein